MGFDSVRRAFTRPLWSPVVALAIAGLPLALPTQEAAAQVAPTPEQAGLPFFDYRLDADELPTARVLESLKQARGNNLAADARAAEVLRLEGFIPLLTIDNDTVYGTPKYIRSTATFLTGESKLSGPEVAAKFVADHPALFEISRDELAKARVSRDYRTQHNGVRHLTFTQQINGVDLFQAELRANVMPDGRLINIGSTMLPRPAADFAVKAPTLTDAQAIDAAARHAGVPLTTPCTPRTDAQGPNQKRLWNNSPDLRPDEPVTTELLYFAATRDDIRTAWKVVIPVKGIGHTYDVIVDANTGELLWRHDWLCFATTQPITFRIYTSDSPAPGSPGTPTPDGFQFPFVESQLVTVTPAMMQTYSPNGWINDGGMETIGNNAAAHLDRDGSPNVADSPRPNGGPGRVFDFTYDVNLEPTSSVTQQHAAVTQLFYWANWYHDQLYALGFDEAAGNFQTINFSGMGVGNDAVICDAQDGSGTNNANFSNTPTDGGTGRCQMYIFTGPTPDRDGDLDGDIVFHELTHGTSIRLHGGLTGTQPQSMGEGWGDFLGLSLNSHPTDDVDAVYAMGAYATRQFFSASYETNYYYGIRRYPYSTSFQKNPLTYIHINSVATLPSDVPRNTGIPNTPNQVHNAGEVWCNALVEGRAAMIRHHGFAGNQRMLLNVVDGMKNGAANPNFLQARDAVIQSNMVNHGGADRSRLWQAFARRGMGVSAQSPNGASTTGIVQAFDTPQFVTFSFPAGDPPTQLQPGIPTTVRIDMAPTDLELTPNTQVMRISVNAAPYQALPMTLVSGNTFEGVIPGQPCGANVAFYFETGTSAGDRTYPTNAPATRFNAAVFSQENTLLSEGFEAGTAGWTSTMVRTPGTTQPLTGQWERTTAPIATAAAPGAAHAGTALWVTQNGLAGGAVGAADVDAGTTTLTSPVMDFSTAADAIVSYWRWFSNNQGVVDDAMTVEVSNNGGTNWVVAETLSGNRAAGWNQASWTLGSVGLAPTSQVRLRFIVPDTGSASVVEAALDDILITSRTCNSTGGCGPQDFNGDGDSGTDQDIEAFFACLGGSCCPACWPGGADFNGDGDTGTDQDIEAFFRVLGGNPC
ncbi:MAG TPA: M36 family metallopeptidase [Phycisphaerales bacterium]|nr:M36 family metallopeptidase [Phycisphaerales bacterium]